MTKIIIVLFLFSLLFVSQKTEAQWVQMSNGIGINKTVKAFTSIGTNIFAGAIDSGVYLSTNNGTTWTQTALNNRMVLSLAVLGSNLFAGIEYRGSPFFYYGIYRSTNNGMNWTLNQSFANSVNTLAVNGNNIFAGTTPLGNPYYGYIYLSSNLGTGWSGSFYIPNASVYSLAVGGNNIFAGIEGSGVYISTNNGTNWTQTSLTNYSVVSLAVNGNNIFAGTTNNGVYRSTNNGTTWTQSTLNNQNVNSLVVSGNNIFAGTQNFGIWLSTNNGTSWTQKNEGFSMIPSVYALYITNNYIFAGTDAQSVWGRPLSEMIGIKNISTEIPEKYSLSQNYPNPFNPTTIINFQLPKNNFVSLKIYDILGREVATLVNEQLKAGTYQADWDASNFASGMYFYKLTADNYSETKRMILIK